MVFHSGQPTGAKKSGIGYRQKKEPRIAFTKKLWPKHLRRKTRIQPMLNLMMMKENMQCAGRGTRFAVGAAGEVERGTRARS